MYPSPRFVLSTVLAARPAGSGSSAGTAKGPRPLSQFESSKSLVIHADGVDVTCRNFHSFVNGKTVACPNAVTLAAVPKINPRNKRAANLGFRRKRCISMDIALWFFPCDCSAKSIVGPDGMPDQNTLWNRKNAKF